ncbi:PEP-CTERM sorting domain-containing protein [Luteolibacter flavescens]|uniref:PEP-CTERM sorting domain-containing protein n=1 Tax=Luteolibacter flavescens TaxID=1859460 RepID=A0ABT3FNQ8_9BACT|nr:PEP-CTERM sorting domain-containing protein [Luteolibacter flavescens]MCW1884969.1 PEP-CTERM sorting domain-containing protein [Luteolibacter flavescens]
MKHLLLSATLLLASAAIAPAATSIILTGTVGTSDSSAYTPGQVITVSFTLADYSATGDPLDYTDEEGEYDWYQEEAENAPIFGNATLTGSTGTFTMPSGDAPEIFLYVSTGIVPSTTYFMVVLGIDMEEPSTIDLGLAVNGDPVRYFGFGFTTPTIFTGLAVPGTNPEEFLSTKLGTYDVEDVDNSYIELVSGDRITFLPTTMEIAIIPEPSTALFSLAAVGLLLRRRRN